MKPELTAVAAISSTLDEVVAAERMLFEVFETSPASAEINSKTHTFRADREDLRSRMTFTLRGPALLG
jgi:hypothetical protein